MKLYLAGGLFNVGERVRNLCLARVLKTLGYEVIVPQLEALKHVSGDKFDLEAVREECRQQCTDPSVLFVGCADGSDVDSGTCVEYGTAIQATGRAIWYRTDFRTDMEREVGVNAMLNLKGTVFLYHPCFLTDLQAGPRYYEELAALIDEAVKKMFE